MKTSQFDYHLPAGLIAQSPIKPRDHSRLLVYDRKTKKINHDHFYNLPRYLKSGDILVFNDIKVFPARLWGRKETGGLMEVFLLRPVKNDIWEVLIGGKVRRVGLKVIFSRGLKCEVVKKMSDGIWLVRFNKTPKRVLAIAETIGTTPTPPYIKQGLLRGNKGYEGRLREQYQTVYAKKVGSVAAPTAGFHFTKRLLAKLRKKGVQFEYVTLHVGYGTFQPVKVEDIRQHKMHAEWAEVDVDTMKRLWRAKEESRTIIAVGTTTVRTLETVFAEYTGSRQAPAWRRQGVGAGAPTYPRGGFRGWIDTFIYPGYKFKFIDAMITNFHLPKSTLLMLVAAFLRGRGTKVSPTRAVRELKRIYWEAIRKKYRFYSFGDGMLIL